MPATGSSDRQVPAIGVVVIGRNEGARLIECLASLEAHIDRVVYVDSGSTDGSAAAAGRAGAQVVALDPSRPFSAARARNAGFEALRSRGAPVDFVQFVDGDCTVRPGWLDVAARFLLSHPGIAVVCGRRRERFPEASIYNRLCDWEWDTPVGEAKACGGDALMRAEAVAAVGGYDETVVAAEDDDLCIRLRKAGWRIWRLDAEMTLHDAAMTRFGQWWRRAVRGGHAFAQVGQRHGDHFRAERRRLWLWGILLPAVAIVSLFAFPPLALGVVALYLASFARSARRFGGRGMNGRETLACAGLLTLSKFPGVQGALKWLVRRASGRVASIIEYK